MDFYYQDTQESQTMSQKENKQSSTNLTGYSKEYWEIQERAEEQSTEKLRRLLGMK